MVWKTADVLKKRKWHVERNEERKIKKKSLMQRGNAEKKKRVAGFGCLLPFKLLQHLVKTYYYNVSHVRNIQSGGTSASCYVSIRTLKRLCKELRMFWANRLGRNCLLWRRSWSISEEAEVVVDGMAIVEVCKPKGVQCFTKSNVYMARCVLCIVSSPLFIAFIKSVLKNLYFMAYLLFVSYCSDFILVLYEHQKYLQT